MEVYSNAKLEDYQIIGDKLRIHWNHQEVTIPSIDGDYEGTARWRCEEAVVKKTASRDEIIEAIIATKYPTYGAEIAAIRNGAEDAQAHEDLRLKAKELADNWVK